MESMSETERTQSEDSYPEITGDMVRNVVAELRDRHLEDMKAPIEPSFQGDGLWTEAEVAERTASQLVASALHLLMEDSRERGWLDLQRWLTSQLDKAYQGGGS